MTATGNRSEAIVRPGPGGANGGLRFGGKEAMRCAAHERSKLVDDRNPAFQVVVNAAPVQHEGHRHTLARRIDDLKMPDVGGDGIVIEIEISEGRRAGGVSSFQNRAARAVRRVPVPHAGA